MEKGRARQELRALLADPAAGFAALSGDEFFAALKQACQDGTANPALIADCERRITSGEAGARELHQLLFAASDRHVWAGARALAMAAAAQVPGTAVAVVGLEAPRLGVAPMQVTKAWRVWQVLQRPGVEPGSELRQVRGQAADLLPSGGLARPGGPVVERQHHRRGGRVTVT